MSTNRRTNELPDISAIRADVEYADEDELHIFPYTAEESAPADPSFSLTGQLLDEFQLTIRNFLQAKSQLIIDPPGKTHIAINGQTICHINVRTPTPDQDGILSARYFSERDTTKDKHKQSVSATRAIPVSIFTGGVLPGSYQLCKYCENKAQELHLVADVSSPPRRPGTPIQECPVCDKSIQSGVPHNVFQIHHHDFSPEVTDSCRDKDNRVADDYRLRVIDERLLPEESLEFFDREVGLNEVPREDRFTGELELHPPAIVSGSDIQLSWANHHSSCGEFRSYRFRSALMTDADNSHMLASGFEIDHPSFQQSRRLLLPELESILADADTISTSIDGDTYPQREDVNVTSAPDTIINEIGSSTPQSTSPEQLATELSFSSSQVRQSLTSLGMVSPVVSSDRYQKETVEQRVKAIDDEYGDTPLSNVSLTGENRNRPFTINGQPSRHYHQRLGAFGQDDVDSCLDRLGITSTPDNGETALIYGGYTGEFASQIANLGHTVIFTDPIADWTAHAETEYNITDTITDPLSELPSEAFIQADFVATFEGYHGLSIKPNSGLYDLLRIIASTTHGYVFAVSFETLTQMKSSSNLSQFRSAYNKMTEVYPDLDIHRRETDHLRVWQLKRSTTVERTLKPLLTDLLTIQAVLDVGSQIALGDSQRDDSQRTVIRTVSGGRPDWYTELTTLDGYEIPLDDVIEQILELHPLASDTSEIVDSLSRLQTLEGGMPATLRIHNFSLSIPPEIQNTIN